MIVLQVTITEGNLASQSNAARQRSQEGILGGKVGRKASRIYQSGWSMLTLLPSVSIFVIQRAHPLVEDTVVR